MARTAERAEACERATTAPIFQSSSRRRRTRVHPRRPAPTSAIVEGMVRDRIAFSLFTFLENRIAHCGDSIFCGAGAFVAGADSDGGARNGEHSIVARNFSVRRAGISAHLDFVCGARRSGEINGGARIAAGARLSELRNCGGG